MDTEIDLKSIISLIRRQIWLIVSTIGVILVLTAIFTYSITPKYQATALIFVDTSSKNLLDAERSFQNAGADNARIESEVGILKSDRIMLETIREANLVSDEEFGVKLGIKDRLFAILRLPTSAEPTESEALARVLSQFRDAVSISRNGLTYLISVSVQSQDPEKAAKLANLITETYIQSQIESKVSAALAARNTLQKRVAAANSSIAENERSIDNYINTNLARIERESGSANLGSMRSQIEQLANMKKQQDERLTSVRASIERRDFSNVNALLGSEALAELQRQRQQIADRLSSSASNQTAAVNLRAELAKIDDMMAKSVQNEADTIQKSVAEYQKQSDELRQQLRTNVLQSNLPSDILTELYSLQQSSEIARTQYQAMLSRLQEMDAQADLQLPDSRVVSPAISPSTPSWPKIPLINAMAAALATCLGVGLALLREHYIGGFTTEDQVEAVLHVPLATIAPRQNTDDNDKSNDGQGFSGAADLMVTAPLSIFSESVRRLRLNLDQAERNKRIQTLEASGAGSEGAGQGTIILATSSVPNEGKSTMAVALARAYALTGKTTLLIDCDLRKPSISRYLNLNPNYDFIDYLRDDIQGVSLASMTMKDPMTNLTALLGGRRSDIATDELVMSEKMSRILMSARRHFDYIILDTPPIEPVVDALYLARHADLIAFVVKWASTPQSIAKRSINALNEHKRADTQIVAVLNQQDGLNPLAYKSYYYYKNNQS